MVIVVTFTEFAIGGANMCSHVCLSPHLRALMFLRSTSVFPELQLTSDTNSQYHHISFSLTVTWSETPQTNPPRLTAADRTT